MTVQGKSRIALRLSLDTGVYALPLERVHHIAGYATLRGAADEYFLGWLSFHGEQVPVFDLNRVVCEAPTAENFGSRIIIVEADENESVRYIGLLAAGVTDTVTAQDVTITELNLDNYMPMLYPLIPALDAETV